MNRASIIALGLILGIYFAAEIYFISASYMAPACKHESGTALRQKLQECKEALVCNFTRW